jgi:hypothetical protein
LLALLVGTAAVSPALADKGKRDGKRADRGKSHGNNPKRGRAHGARFWLKLTGAEIPAPGGDPDGKGAARFVLLPERQIVCVKIRWVGLDEVTAAHIHKAPRGAVGPHHIDLFNDEHFAGAWNRFSACVHVEDGGHGSTQTATEKIRAVIQNPEDYYLNVHTTGYPHGAIRGQFAAPDRSRDGKRGHGQGGRKDRDRHHHDDD